LSLCRDSLKWIKILCEALLLSAQDAKSYAALATVHVLRLHEAACVEAASEWSVERLTKSKTGLYTRWLLHIIKQALGKGYRFWLFVMHIPPQWFRSSA
jgi:hypothetical protein